MSNIVYIGNNLIPYENFENGTIEDVINYCKNHHHLLILEEIMCCFNYVLTQLRQGITYFQFVLGLSGSLE